jgi:hypothetical protein
MTAVFPNSVKYIFTLNQALNEYIKEKRTTTTWLRRKQQKKED